MEIKTDSKEQLDRCEYRMGGGICTFFRHLSMKRGLQPSLATVHYCEHEDNPQECKFVHW